MESATLKFQTAHLLLCLFLCVCFPTYKVGVVVISTYRGAVRASERTALGKPSQCGVNVVAALPVSVPENSRLSPRESAVCREPGKQELKVKGSCRDAVWIEFCMSVRGVGAHPLGTPSDPATAWGRPPAQARRLPHAPGKHALPACGTVPKCQPSWRIKIARIRPEPVRSRS